MAKVIKYKFLSCEVNRGTEDKPDIEQILLEKSMEWNESNEENAKREAYNGEYTIEDDGKPEPVVEQTTEQRIAELEEAIELLLSGVTE